MSDVYARDRNEYRQGITMESDNSDENEFAEWLTGQVMETYAQKITAYCNSKKNCKKCTFFNGVCRLNRFPWDWN